MVELKTESITEKLKFKGNWRNYQQNCLNLLDKYLDDNKLNIVAAPGAGKTILGIEVISRLKQNVIIFIDKRARACYNPPVAPMKFTL